MSDISSLTITLKQLVNGLSGTPEHDVPATKQSVKARPVPMVIKLTRMAFSIGGLISPTIAGRFAYKLWFSPTRFKTPAREQKVMDEARIEYLPINNHTIATYRWGVAGGLEKPAVLLVHGWSGRGTQLGSFVQPLLDAGFEVVSLDLPAHGKSSGKQTNLYEVADTLIALQNYYGEFESVITHSFGGLCIARAVQCGFKTKRIVSISPPATAKGLVVKFNKILHVPAKAASKMIQQIENTFGETLWDDIAMVNTAKELKMPGLLIHDSNDDDIPWQEGEAVAKAWTNARFVKTSGLGHRRILRDDTVIETVIDFIRA